MFDRDIVPPRGRNHGDGNDAVNNDENGNHDNPDSSSTDGGVYSSTKAIIILATGAGGLTLCVYI